MSCVWETPRWPIQKWKKEGDRLTGVRDKITFIDIRIQNRQVVAFRKEEGRMSHKLHVLGIIDDLWDRVCGLDKIWEIELGN